MTFGLDMWRVGLSRSSSKVKVTGHISSHKRRDGAKVVGATSSDGFVTKYRGILEHRYLDIRSDGIC